MKLSRAQEYGRKFGFKRAYDHVETMLQQEKPDAVFLVIPPQLTATVAAEIIKGRFPLFLEKPPGLDSQELNQLITLAEQTDTLTQVGFNRRYMPLIQAGKEVIREKFSSIFQVDYQLIRYNRHDPDFSVTAIHAIDTAHYLAGSSYRHVELDYHKVVDACGCATNVTLRAECVSGAQIRLNIQPVAGHISETVAVHGNGQTLVLNLGGAEQNEPGQLFYYERDKLKDHRIDASTSIEEKQGVTNELEAFCCAVHSHAKTSPCLAECVQQVALMTAIRRQVSSVRF